LPNKEGFTVDGPKNMELECNPTGIILNQFAELSKIPRKSGNESEIRSYLVSKAKEYNLEPLQDETGNLLMEIPKTDSGSNSGIILQCHMDMVCKGKPDPGKVGVNFQIDRESLWIFAKGTTLGADDGIGISIALATLNKELKHGPLALLFTVNEEAGMDGARSLNFPELQKYKYLINLDSEEEGQAITGSAGGQEVNIILPIIKEKPDVNGKFFEIKIEKLLSGHSGIDIDKNRANAIKLLLKIIAQYSDEIRLSNISGGDVPNAIPESITSTIFISNINQKKIIDALQNDFAVELQEYDEPKAVLTIKESDAPASILSHESQLLLTNLVDDIPNGVTLWDQEIKGLPFTSNNIGVTRQKGNNIVIKTSSRSFDVGSLQQIISIIDDAASKHKAGYTNNPPYSGWKVGLNSQIVQVSKSTYESVFGKSLEIAAIHAGLECGLICSKYPQLEAISIGPTIKDVHTVHERASIESVSRFYSYLINLIKNLGKI
jgi:dipeptidase D